MVAGDFKHVVLQMNRLGTFPLVAAPPLTRWEEAAVSRGIL
jgi:hypothetical protein